MDKISDLNVEIFESVKKVVYQCYQLTQIANTVKIYLSAVCLIISIIMQADYLMT